MSVYLGLIHVSCTKNRKETVIFARAKTEFEPKKYRLFQYSVQAVLFGINTNFKKLNARGWIGDRKKKRYIFVGTKSQITCISSWIENRKKNVTFDRKKLEIEQKKKLFILVNYRELNRKKPLLLLEKNRN